MTPRASLTPLVSRKFSKGWLSFFSGMKGLRPGRWVRLGRLGRGGRIGEGINVFYVLNRKFSKCWLSFSGRLGWRRGTESYPLPPENPGTNCLKTHTAALEP